MSDSVRPHRRQPTRLPHSWDSPGKNTGVACHFLLQCLIVKSESEVAQSCPALRDPMDCSPPGSSVHGIFPGKSTGVGCQHFSLSFPLSLVLPDLQLPAYPSPKQCFLINFRETPRESELGAYCHHQQIAPCYVVVQLLSCV